MSSVALMILNQESAEHNINSEIKIINYKSHSGIEYNYGEYLLTSSLLINLVQKNDVKGDELSLVVWS